ncbi:MAG: ArnT family glycosyltransferase, partial [Candidatus Omnitrophota bacterium]
MSPANPPLIRQWMALPWLAINPKLDLEKKSWKEADSVPFAREFFYKDNREIADRLLYTSRFMILLLGTGLGWVIYAWSRALYGEEGGLLSLSLYAFCPAFIAHSSIAHTDVGVTLFCALSAYFLWRTLEFSGFGNLLAFSLSFGLACAAKYNALLLGPLFLLVVLIRGGFLKFALIAAVVTVVSFLVVWAATFFELKPLLWDGVPRMDEKLGYIAAISNALFPGNETMRLGLQEVAQKISIPMPSFILGVAGILRS